MKLESDPFSEAVVMSCFELCANKSITPFSRAQVDNKDDGVIGFCFVLNYHSADFENYSPLMFCALCSVFVHLEDS